MIARLYVETNFLLSHAHGRDPATDRLIGAASSSLRIGIPGGCVMEALGVLESEGRRINDLSNLFRIQGNEMGRNQVSPPALRLESLLREGSATWKECYSLFQRRFTEAIHWLGSSDQVDLLMISPAGLVELRIDQALRDPTDTLILATILEDARAHPTISKVLVTENSRCFHQDREVRSLLAQAGIRYFARLGDFLQWYEVGSES